MGEKEPVYCQTSPNYCRPDDILLGYTWPGMKLRCPICGRHTVAGKPEPLTQMTSTSVPWRKTGIDY